MKKLKNIILVIATLIVAFFCQAIFSDDDEDSGESTKVNNLSKDEQEKLFRELYYQHYGFYPGENNLEYEEEEFVPKQTSSTTTKVQDKNSQNASDCEQR